jgi:hypothetical protein
MEYRFPGNPDGWSPVPYNITVNLTPNNGGTSIATASMLAQDARV